MQSDTQATMNNCTAHRPLPLVSTATKTCSMQSSQAVCAKLRKTGHEGNVTTAVPAYIAIPASVVVLAW